MHMFAVPRDGPLDPFTVESGKSALRTRLDSFHGQQGQLDDRLFHHQQAELIRTSKIEKQALADGLDLVQFRLG